jgi:hypothetical protein
MVLWAKTPLQGLLESGIWGRDLLLWLRTAGDAAARALLQAHNAAMGFGGASRLMARNWLLRFYLAVQTLAGVRARRYVRSAGRAARRQHCGAVCRQPPSTCADRYG